MYVIEKHQPKIAKSFFIFFYKISLQKMNGIMNENVIVKDYEFDKPLIQMINSILHNCIRDCRNKIFHTFYHISVYDIKLTNIGNKEISNLTLSGKTRLCMN